MAASFLSKSGRVVAFKTLQLQAWGFQRLTTPVFLSTKSEEPKTHSAKNKGEAINSTKPDGAVKLADEDLRKFLARKTLITFPQKILVRESISSSTEAKPTVATQEDFDISSYKNLQHHEYTPFTFVDFDVELSKFRLPQPSSGRISPRH